MAEMQGKLEEYRLRKRRKEKFDEFKNKIKSFLMLGTGGGGTKEQLDHIVDVEHDVTDKKKLLPEEVTEGVSSEEEEIDECLTTTDEELTSAENKPIEAPTALEQENKLFKYTLWAVYFLFWVTVYIIAIELKFGLVYLMFSALLGIYFNTRTGPKKRNEVSAYSVFNKNCKSIEGALTAEQFEREMRYGAGSVR